MAREITEYADGTCWTDIAHVAVLTGITVSEAELVRAQEMINMVSGVYPERLPDDLLDGDRRRLENALCYQAAWMKGRVDLFRTVAAESLSQASGSVKFAHEKAQFYGELAWQEIRALSWNNESIRTRDGKRRWRDSIELTAAFLAGDEDADAAAGPYCTVPGRPFA
jgi:hypothetical protein